MKRLLLAGLLVLPMARARAESDAYGSLVGMAVSASSDRGPEAGTIPERTEEPETPGSRSSSGKPGAARARSQAPAARTAAAGSSAPAIPTGSTRSSGAPRRDDDAPAVSVPAAPAPRTWIRFFSSLLPPMRRMPAFEVEASTAPRKARPAPAPAVTAASVDGAARGLRELVALSTAR